MAVCCSNYNIRAMESISSNTNIQQSNNPSFVKSLNYAQQAANKLVESIRNRYNISDLIKDHPQTDTQLRMRYFCNAVNNLKYGFSIISNRKTSILFKNIDKCLSKMNQMSKSYKFDIGCIFTAPKLLDDIQHFILISTLTNTNQLSSFKNEINILQSTIIQNKQYLSNNSKNNLNKLLLLLNNLVKNIDSIANDAEFKQHLVNLKRQYND